MSGTAGADLGTPGRPTVEKPVTKGKHHGPFGKEI
jgi:hypothetical protein